MAAGFPMTEGQLESYLRDHGFITNLTLEDHIKEMAYIKNMDMQQWVKGELREEFDARTAASAENTRQ